MLSRIDLSPIWIPCALQKEKKKSLFAKVNDLVELGNVLKLSEGGLEQWMAWKDDIKSFISQHSSDEKKLDDFFKIITEIGLKENYQKFLSFFVEIVSLDKLVEVVRSKKANAPVPFKDVFSWAEINAPLITQPATCPHSIKTHCLAEWKRYRPLIIYFIPNLINIFLGAFNFLDPQKKYTSLWEKYLLLDIIYKFFTIPFGIIHILKPILVVSTKVYIVAAAIIVSIGALLTCYQRWLKPLPDEIFNCTNLDRQMERGLIDHKVGQVDEIEKLIAALEGDNHVVLIGRSGEGKTALMHHFIRLKHEKKLSEKLQKLAAFEVDCGLMISSVSFGHSDLINQIKDKTSGFEDRIVLFFDEFFQVANNEGAFQAFKKRFLDDKPNTKFVATMTIKEYEELKKIDKDSSFRRRVTPIPIEANEDQTRLIIQDSVDRIANHIHVNEDAVNEILKISNKKKFLPDVGRPAKAIKILKEATGICQTVYNPKYVTTELNQTLQKYQGLKYKAKGKSSGEFLKKSQKFSEKIKKLEEKLEKDKKHIHQIKRNISVQSKMNSEYFRLTSQIAQSAEKQKAKGIAKNSGSVSKSQALKNGISEIDQMKYLWYYFYGLNAIKTLLSQEIDSVSADHNVEINAKLIQEVYKQSKLNEKKLSDQGKIV